VTSSATATFDQLADRYDQHFDTRLGRAEDAALARFLAPLADGQRVLDMGCGTGHVLVTLEHAGARPRVYLGIDASRRMVERAYRLHEFGRAATFMVGDVCNGAIESLPRSHFDLAISLWSYPYYDHSLRALSSARRVLVRGGTAVIMGWAGRYRYRRSYITPDISYQQDTPRSLVDQARAVGFESASVVPFRCTADRWVKWLPEAAITRLLEAEMAALPARLGMAYLLVAQ
jgi:SAM-dependent methyltransferase